jgi:hypothetical protein
MLFRVDDYQGVEVVVDFHIAREFPLEIRLYLFVALARVRRLKDRLSLHSFRLNIDEY